MGSLSEELAKVLHRKRRAYRYTQSDLGQRIGMSGSYISSLESGRSSPRLAELEDLAVHFRTTALELLHEAASADERYVAAHRDGSPRIGLDALAEDLNPQARAFARQFIVFLREREHVDGDAAVED
jgi:transcriptional regulator with XRE-family HTH domain